MKLEVYRHADGLYAWRFKASNGQIIATDGGQGYENWIDCANSGELATYARFRPGVDVIVNHSHPERP